MFKRLSKSTSVKSNSNVVSAGESWTMSAIVSLELSMIPSTTCTTPFLAIQASCIVSLLPLIKIAVSYYNNAMLIYDKCIV